MTTIDEGTTTWTRRHVCMNVRGFIRNTPRHEMAGIFTKDDGTPASADEAFDFLMDQIALGHKVIPLGDCDNFDYQTGCRGHAMSDEEVAAEGRGA